MGDVEIITPLAIDAREQRKARRREAARLKVLVDLLKDYSVALMVAAWFQPLVNGLRMGPGNYGMILLSLVSTVLALTLVKGGDHDEL